LNTIDVIKSLIPGDSIYVIWKEFSLGKTYRTKATAVFSAYLEGRGIVIAREEGVRLQIPFKDITHISKTN